MRDVIFGTAHLFGLADEATSLALLDRAWDVGVRRYDTAPSYGLGRSEVRLGEVLRRRSEPVVLTSKVGLAPPIGPAGARRLAKQAAALLPASARQRLRGKVQSASRGQFSVPEVRASLQTSLTRLGRVDRLLLHEVEPDDITPELLELLGAWVARGDVGAVGVATRNEHTAAVLSRAPDLLTVVHVEAGVLSSPVALPPSVRVRVGHGLLGPGGEHLRRLRDVLAARPQLHSEWSDAVRDTPYDGPGGLAAAMLTASGATGVDEVIVATTRIAVLQDSCRQAAALEQLPTAVSRVLTALTAAAAAQPAA